MLKLAKQIIEGRRISDKDDLEIFRTCNLDELRTGADLIRSSLCGNHIDMCAIINARAGKCSEDCKFCAQSSHYNTGCSEHDMLDADEVVKDCISLEHQGVHAYSMVTAGKQVSGSDIDKLELIYKQLNEHTNMRLCASHGFIKAEDFKRLYDAGVRMYHSNIETSRRFFPHICTTHTFDEKLLEIKAAKEANLEVCSGGIIGMGEEFEDRLDMALTLSALKIKSIPINVLMPVAGTPLENVPPLSKEDILRCIAVFRYINPTAYIRMAAGRARFEDGGIEIFKSGANATITGNMLTTVGNNIKQDKEMFVKNGFDISQTRCPPPLSKA